MRDSACVFANLNKGNTIILYDLKWYIWTIVSLIHNFN